MSRRNARQACTPPRTSRCGPREFHIATCSLYRGRTRARGGGVLAAPGPEYRFEAPDRRALPPSGRSGRSALDGTRREPPGHALRLPRTRGSFRHSRRRPASVVPRLHAAAPDARTGGRRATRFANRFGHDERRDPGQSWSPSVGRVRGPGTAGTPAAETADTEGRVRSGLPAHPAPPLRPGRRPAAQEKRDLPPSPLGFERAESGWSGFLPPGTGRIQLDVQMVLQWI